MAPNNPVFRHYAVRLEQHNTIMKLINLKVLLFAALCTPFAAMAQTCTVESTNSGKVESTECFLTDEGRVYNVINIKGNGNLTLTELRYQDLTGVKIVFEKAVPTTFSGDAFTDKYTFFVPPSGGGALKVETSTDGKQTYSFQGQGNGENKLDDLNDKLSQCDDVCTLADPARTFVMPVTLMSWITQIDGKQVTLDWETADEQDNSHFVVSRSTDGSTFTELGTIGGRGTTGSVSTYRFRDQKPATGVNYYRLEQYDYDGTRTELGVQSVDFGGRVTGNLMLSPNPVASGQMLTFDGHVDGETEIEIFAPNGSHVGNYLVQGGTFRVPTLKPGMYTLRMNGQASRLVVAR